MDGVAKALQEDPHMLMLSIGFLVNTGKQLILVDAGAGTWWGGGALGAWRTASAAQVTHRKKSISFAHAPPFRSCRRPDHSGRMRVFQMPMLRREGESDFWLSPEIAAKAPRMRQPFFQSARAIGSAVHQAGKWHTFRAPSNRRRMQLVPLHGHTPGHTGYEFSSKGQKILFWGDIVHAQRIQMQHPEVTRSFRHRPDCRRGDAT